MHVVTKLIVEPRVELTPESHLLNHLSDLLLFVFVVGIVFLVFQPLLLHKRFHDELAFGTDLEGELSRLRLYRVVMEETRRNVASDLFDLLGDVEPEYVALLGVVPKTQSILFPRELPVLQKVSKQKRDEFFLLVFVDGHFFNNFGRIVDMFLVMYDEVDLDQRKAVLWQGSRPYRQSIQPYPLFLYYVDCSSWIC